MTFHSMAEIGEEILAKYGKEAHAHAVETAERHGTSEAHKAQIMRFAMATAALVPEFNGQYAPAIYDCHECEDHGFTIVEEFSRIYQRPIERAMPCQKCDKGLTREAALWLDITEPKHAKGQRHSSEDGWREFNVMFKHKPQRREMVRKRMDSMKGQQRQAGEEA